MTVDNCLKCDPVGEENVLQHLAFRGYNVIEQLSTFQDAVTYAVKDNREPEGYYCLARVLPLNDSDEPILELFQPTPTISAAAQLLGGFQVDGYSYLIRQYIPGQPLAWEIPNRIGWREAQVIDLLQSILKTLAQCHQEGAVHGNLHPNNVIRRPDRQLILTDFTGNQGRYHQTLRHPKMGLKSNILGLLEHPAYAAPEQWQGCHQPSSDIYAVGMLGLQFLLGRQSWTSETELNQLLKTLPCQPLVTILKRMVDSVPDQRYINAQLALFALENVQLGDPIPQPPLLAKQKPMEQERKVIQASFDLSPWQLYPSHHQFSQRQNKLKTLANSKSLASQAVKVANAIPHASSSSMGSVITSRSVAFPSLESEPSLTCRTPKFVHPELMATETLVLASPTSLTTVSIDDLARPTMFQLPKANSALAAKATVLLAPELPKESPYLTSSGLKWTSAILAMAASVGGSVVLYQNWTPPNQGATSTTDISSTSATDPEFVPTNQVPAPIPVPEAPTEFDVGPSFSQSQIDYYFARAYHHARVRGFSKALTYLEQIPQQTERYPEAQAKIAEYREKREIKAQALLNRAYKQAAAANFDQALNYLYQIPTQTEAYNTALEKIVEYREKQELQAAHQISEMKTDVTFG